MSNFPYNNDKYRPMDEPPNGTPVTFKEARAFADTILFWHTENRTGDFSQSGDGFWDGTVYLALGLLELLSDPNAIHRLMTTGREVKNQIGTIDAVSKLDGPKTGLPDLIMPVLDEVFKE